MSGGNLPLGATDSANFDRQFWQLIDERIDKRVDAILEPTLRNHRPRGNAPITLVIGSPGVTLTATSAAAGNEWMHLIVPYPCQIQRAEVYGAASGSGTFDVWMFQKSQTIASAATILGSNPLTLSSSRSNKITPASDWTIYIPAGSVLMPFCTAASSLTLVSINFVVKCV